MDANKLKPYIVGPKNRVREVMEVIDKNREGIALVTDDGGRLVGTITDGDLRRFMIANRSLDEPCTNVMWINPCTSPVGTPNDSLLSLMNQHSIRSLPLLDGEGLLADIVHIRHLLSKGDQGLVAVIMAGGDGKRLRPLTRKMPKPMVKVGDRPILENILLSLAQYGITNIYLTVNYQARMIEDYFEDGSRHGVEITYLREKSKMGTAGGLSLMAKPPIEPLIVMNGDVVTNVNFTRILDFHRQHRAVMSVAACEYHINVPYGVLNLAGHYVLGINEKPSNQFLCNAGIYVINPELIRLIPPDRPYNMTDLIQDVVRQGLPVTAFPIREYWIDIGQKENLQKARVDFQSTVGALEENN